MDDLTKPLDRASLSPEAQKALSGPMKTMAARGLAPIADPLDLLTVLFQLSADSDAQIRAAATKTARSLPENLTSGALTRAELHPKVLHFFGAILPRGSEGAKHILLNQSTADQTVAELARRATEAEVNLIAANEERMLREPSIITGLYENPNALQSVVDRAIELAIRNDVRVAGIACWEEIASELMSSGHITEVDDSELAEPIELSKIDRLISRYLTLKDGESVPNPEAIHKLSAVSQMRIASVGPTQYRNMLLRSRKTAVAMAAIKSPKVNEADAAKHAGNLSLGEEVIRYIASRREWTKNYTVKTALVNNPKCPLPAAMRMMPFLRERDLSNLARSKNIPSALRAQARKLLTTRKGGGRR